MKRVVIIGLVIAVVLGVLLATRPPVPPDEDGVALPAPDSKTLPEEVRVGSVIQEAEPATEIVIETPSGPKVIRGSSGGSGRHASDPKVALVVDPEGEFSEADLAAADEPVAVTLGRYAATVGDEITVEVVLSAPALESLTLLLRYEPTQLAFVDGSASAVSGFWKGIECHASRPGLIAIINETEPGSRNVKATAGEVIVRFAMRALAPGMAELLLDEEHCSFVNALGDEATTVTLNGGLVNVR